MAAYCQAAEVVSQLALGSSTGNRADLVAAAIDDATAWIDRYCGRDFNRLTEVREFGPKWSGCRTVATGDISAPTAVATRPDRHSPWAPLDGGDYALDRRLAGSSQHPEYPAQGIMVYADVAPFPYRPWPETTIQVAATFGWPAVPGPVRRACIVIAARHVEFMARPGFQAGDFNPVMPMGAPAGSVSEAIRQLLPYRKIGAG